LQSALRFLIDALTFILFKFMGQTLFYL